MQRYAQLHQADVACTPAAIEQVILGIGGNSYQSCLCHIIEHLGGAASVNAPAPEMEATMLCQLFNQALSKLSPQQQVELKRSMHRYGLRAKDWVLVMEQEQVDGDHLKQLLMAEGYMAYQLSEKLAGVIFEHLLAHGEPEGSQGIFADIFLNVLFGRAFCLMVDTLRSLFGVDDAKLIPLVLHVAVLRRRKAFRV